MTPVTQNDPGFYRNGGWGHDADAEQAWVDEHVIPLGLQAGQRLLDIGCGDGLHARIFAGHGLEVVGIDPNPEAIEVAKEATAIAPVGVKPPEFICSGLETLPDDIGRFDVAFARGVRWTGQPAGEQAHAAIATIHELLKRRGRVVIVRATNGSGKVSPGSVPGDVMWNPSLAEFDGLLGDGFSAQELSTIPPFVLLTGRRK